MLNLRLVVDVLQECGCLDEISDLVDTLGGDTFVNAGKWVSANGVLLLLSMIGIECSTPFH